MLTFVTFNTLLKEGSQVMMQQDNTNPGLI